MDLLDEIGGIDNEVQKKEVPKKVLKNASGSQNISDIVRKKDAKSKIVHLTEEKYEKLKKIASKNKTQIGAALDDILTYFFENWKI